MKRISKVWPFLLIVPIYFLNVDITVIPFLRMKDVNIFLNMAISGVVSTIELAIWSWFWKSVNLPKYTQKYLIMTNGGRIGRWTQRWGDKTLFILGITPEPGFRTAGLIMHHALKIKNGFLMLAVGNFLHIIILVLGWDLLFWLAEKN